MPLEQSWIDGQRLKHFVQNTVRLLGRLTGFVRRASKLSAEVFVQSLVLGCLRRPDASLNDFAQCSAALGVMITPAGIDERITGRASALLKEVFGQALAAFRNQQPIPGTVLEQFTGIYLTDSTQINLPAAFQASFPGSGGSASPAALKVVLSFNYLTGVMNALQLAPGRKPDQASDLPLEGAAPGSLHLFDLGFFKRRLLLTLQRCGAFFVCRLNTQVHLYAQPHGAPLDLLAFLRQTTANLFETPLYLKGKPYQAVRLVGVRLPPQEVSIRHRKAWLTARRKGRTCSARQLELLAWNLYLTNVPAQRLSATQVGLLYRLRWQIELLFKLWKSQAGVAQVHCWRLDRLLCQLYARLIGLVLFHWIVAPYRLCHGRELSLPKAFRIFQNHTAQLLLVLAQRGRGLSRFLARLLEIILRFACKSQRKASPSTYQRLLDSEALA